MPSKDTFFKRQTSDQPGWAKGIENVIIVGGVALAIYLIYRNAQKEKEKKDATKGAGAATAGLKDLEAQGIKPSYQDALYYGWVDVLVQAMNGCGTDEDAIYQVFDNMKNDADVLKLIEVFNIQYYEPCGWSSPIAAAIWEFNDQAYGGELTTWFGYDLSSSNISTINAILQQKGIKYRF